MPAQPDANEPCSTNAVRTIIQFNKSEHLGHFELYKPDLFL